MILISVEAVWVMSGDVGEVTVLLNAMKSGDATAADKLLGLVYQELHLAGEGVHAAGTTGPHVAAYCADQ